MSEFRGYFPPATCTTGSVDGQPRPAQTFSGWFFDAHLNYQDTGFIDAPELIPVGSTRALDSGPLTLALTHLHREPQTRCF